MSEPAINYFCEQVEAVIARCRQEWDMSYCELLGTIEIIKAGLLEEALVMAVCVRNWHRPRN